MKKSKAMVRILSLIMAAVLASSTFLTVSALTNEEQAAQLEDEIKSIQQKIEQNEAKMAELKKKADGQQEYINELQSQIDTVQAKIDLMNEGIAAVQKDIDQVDGEIQQLEAEIAELESKIAKLDEEIVEKQQEIADTYTMLGQRIRALYLSGPTSDLELLLSSDSFEFETFLAQLELLDRISEHDNNLVESIKQGIEQIEKIQAQIQVSIEERDADKATLEEKKSELDAKKQKQVAARAEVQVEENKVQADLNEVMSYVNSLNATSAQYQKINDAAEKTIEEYEAKIVDLLRDDSSSGSGTVSSGMVWPVQYSNTYISSSFKMRTLNGVTRQHNGIDICVSGGSYGKTISAAAAGKVIAAYHSGYNGGYGLYVVIDHGNGVQTYYAHCSSVRVSVGQTVSKGQAIAAIGNTGYSFGAHLHFGVLVNGVWKNPRNYVPKPSDCRVDG